MFWTIAFLLFIFFQRYRLGGMHAVDHFDFRSELDIKGNKLFAIF